MPPTEARSGAVEVKVMRLGAGSPMNGLLDLGGGAVGGVAGLVGVDDAGAGGEKVTTPARMVQTAVEEPSIDEGDRVAASRRRSRSGCRCRPPRRRWGRTR